MAVDQEKSAELVARLERLPFSRWHRNFFVLASFRLWDGVPFSSSGLFLPCSFSSCDGTCPNPFAICSAKAGWRKRSIR